MINLIDTALQKAHLDFPVPAENSTLDHVKNAVTKQPGGYAWLLCAPDNPILVASSNSDFDTIFKLPTATPTDIEHLNINRASVDTLRDVVRDVVTTGTRKSCILHQHMEHDGGGLHSIALSVSRLSDETDSVARVAVSAREATERRRAEVVARHATDLLRSMIDGVQEYAVFMLNTDHIIASWNAGATRLTGKTGHDVVGRSVSILSHETEEDATQHINWADVVTTAQTQNSAHAEGWMKKADGLFWGTVSCTRMTNNGTLRGYAVVIHDLTEKLRSEKALRDSERRFRDFAESASDWFWETDQNLHLNFLSDTFKNRLGVEPDTLLGKAHYQFSDLHEGAEQWWEHLRALNTHKPFRNFHYAIPLPDGRNIHVSDSGKPLFNDKGEFVGYRGAGRDITHEIRAREAANTIANRFFSAMDTASEGILLFDAHRKLVFWNKRTVTLFPDLARKLRSGLRYSTLLYILNRCRSDEEQPKPHGGREGARGLRDKFNTPLNDVETTDETRLTDGRTIRLAERRTSEGGVTFVLTDITDAVAHEQQMRQSYKMEALGQLTGGVAHDFNNLLTVVRGNLEMVEPHVDDNPRLAKRVHNALEAVSRGADLTSRLLGFARQQPSEAHILKISDHMATLLPLLRQAIGSSIHFIPTIQDIGSAELDASQFDNAILNLCINARDAMPEGGELSLTTDHVQNLPLGADSEQISAPHGWAVIRITDTGTGMSEDVLQRAFDPFFTTKEHGKGSGLGLSMVYGFIRRSRGTVQIDSRIGRGTSIRLYLPIAASGHGHVATPENISSTPLSGDETILLVEDNIPAQEVISAMLEEMGYTVLTAPDGNDAVNTIAETNGIDLVLTDFSMPGGLNGLDVARAARHHQKGIPIVLMSGFAELIPDRTGTELADMPILYKPFTMVQLSQVLRETLAPDS